MGNEWMCWFNVRLAPEQLWMGTTETTSHNLLASAVHRGLTTSAAPSTRSRLIFIHPLCCTKSQFPNVPQIRGSDFIAVSLCHYVDLMSFPHLTLLVPITTSYCYEIHPFQFTRKSSRFATTPLFGAFLEETAIVFWLVSSVIRCNSQMYNGLHVLYVWNVLLLLPAQSNEETLTLSAKCVQHLLLWTHKNRYFPFLTFIDTSDGNWVFTRKKVSVRYICSLDLW